MEVFRYTRECEPKYDVYQWIKENDELDIEIEESFCGFQVLGNPAWEILRDAANLHRGSSDDMSIELFRLDLREKMWWSNPDKELIEILESLLALYKGDDSWKCMI